MKKYKLIKEYPGSPPLCNKSCNIIRLGNDNYYHNYSTMYPVTIHSNSISNYPEFWEEVVEKDYEILKQEYVPGYCYHGNQNPNQYKIISIKRLSDGEVFTIGDLCNPIGKYSYNEQVIEKIGLNKNGCLYFSSKNWHIGLSSIEHSKKPLFISEDGIEMYEGDPFWYVCKSLEFTGIFESTRYANAPNTCYFSNKKDAEKYVLENKKSLSLKDVALVIGECNNTTYVDLELLTHKLKKIIKSEERK